MDSEVWLHKYELKLRWNVKDDALVDYIMHKGLKAYNDKKIGPLPLKDYERPTIIAYSRWMLEGRNFTPPPPRRLLYYTSEFFKENMAYFKLVDILDFEIENGLTPIDSPKLSQADATADTKIKETELNTLSIPDFIKMRRDQNVNDDIIASELHEEEGPYRLTYVNIARALELDTDLQPDQHDAIKKRGQRAVESGRKQKK